MIKIHYTDNAMFLSGQPNCAERGQDIIIANVSTLVQTFVLALNDLTSNTVELLEYQQSLKLQHGELSNDGLLLKNALIVGLKNIEKEYLESLSVIELTDGDEIDAIQYSLTSNTE